jgi:hypothetical protein
LYTHALLLYVHLMVFVLQGRYIGNQEDIKARIQGVVVS